MNHTQYLLDNYRTMSFELYEYFVYMLSGKHVTRKAQTIANVLTDIEIKENEPAIFPQGHLPKVNDQKRKEVRLSHKQPSEATKKNKG